ncbi:ABC transporter permease [Williamsia soli]|uniref:ABC transporter permease n=1 Tax=Williamsia soli TaxID=364929 RepID=UPI001A9CB985|nr:ABC transporter permease [Williamsia soli]
MNRKLIGTLLGLAAVVVLMAMAFVLPLKASGADGLPVGIAGSAEATTQVEQSLATAAPGDYDFRSYGSADELRAAIEDREIVGAIAVAPENPTVMVTSAGGQQIAQNLRGVGTVMSAQTGTEFVVEDVVPTTSDDPTAAGISGLALPLVLGGMLPAVVLGQLLPRKPLSQALYAGGFAMIAGFALGAILRFGIGTYDGNFVLVSLGLALGMWAISLPLIGLKANFGFAGFGAGAATMMMVGQPLSGIASSAYWLPSGWAGFGQLLPPGASATLLRSLAFFDGNGGGVALVTMLCWVVVGAGLVLVARKRTPADEDSDTTPQQEPVLV